MSKSRVLLAEIMKQSSRWPAQFQQGKAISLYQEKQAEETKHTSDVRKGYASQKFIMLCGLPGSGKHTRVLESLFTVSDTIRASSFILDKNRVIYSLPKALRANSQ